jgi:serine phosphatase RsbU (regulator of sigma subunit)
MNKKQSEEEERMAVFILVNRFPLSFFVFSTCFMIGLSITYHVYFDFLVQDNDYTSSSFWYRTFFDVLYEQALGLIMTLIYYSAFTRLTKPAVVKLNLTHTHGSADFTHYRRVLLMTVSTLLIMATFLSQLFMTSAHLSAPVHPAKLLILISLFIILAVYVVRFTLLDMTGSMKEITDRLDEIEGYDSIGLHSPIPLTSVDEVGRLVSAYNRIQFKIQSVYRETEEDLKLAYKVQQHLLPSGQIVFRRGMADIHYQPAREVGGDFYYVEELPSGQLLAVIGDVSGKGLPAALIVSVLLGYLEAQVKSFTGSPASMLHEVNRMMMPILHKGMYVTMGIGLLDPEERKLAYASAGHLFPIIRKTEGDCRFASAGSSFPLGIAEDERYDDEVTCLEQDDEAILFYTDGLVEQMDEMGRITGFGKLERVLRNPLVQTAEHVVKELLIPDHGVKQQDDMTLLLLRMG